LQGFSDQAVRTAELSIAEAEATGHTLSLCHILAVAACPIALWTGNLAAAAHHTGVLLEHSRKHSLWLWNFGSRFHRAVAIRSGDLDTGLPLAGPNQFDEPNVSFRLSSGLNDPVEALAHAGRIAEGLAMLEGVEQSEAGWIAPELLRLRGELLLSQGAPAAAETAESLFRQALDFAPARGAFVGVARCNEPRPPAEQSRPSRRGHRLPAVGLRSVHRRFRHRRFDRRETASG
jgi:hypothetical protein